MGLVAIAARRESFRATDKPWCVVGRRLNVFENLVRNFLTPRGGLSKRQKVYGQNRICVWVHCFIVFGRA